MYKRPYDSFFLYFLVCFCFCFFNQEAISKNSQKVEFLYLATVFGVCAHVHVTCACVEVTRQFTGVLVICGSQGSISDGQVEGGETGEKAGREGGKGGGEKSKKWMVVRFR